MDKIDRNIETAMVYRSCVPTSQSPVGMNSLVFRDSEFSNKTKTLADGTRELLNIGLGNNATLDAGFMLDGDGTSQHIETNIIPAVEAFTIYWSQEVPVGNASYLLNGAGSSPNRLEFGIPNDIVNLFIAFGDVVTVTVPHGVTAGSVGNFCISWNGISASLEIYSEGAQVGVLEGFSAPSVIAELFILARNTAGLPALRVFGAFGNFYFIQEHSYPEQVANHYNNPEHTLWNDANGDLQSSNGYDVDKFLVDSGNGEAGWITCGENESVGAFVHNLGALSHGNNLTGYDPIFTSVDGVGNTINNIDDQTCEIHIEAATTVSFRPQIIFKHLNTSLKEITLTITVTSGEFAFNKIADKSPANLGGAKVYGVGTHTLKVYSDQGTILNTFEFSGITYSQVDVTLHIEMREVLSGVEPIVNYHTDMRLGRYDKGNQAVLSYLNAFGLPISPAKPFEVVAGDRLTIVDTGLNVGDADFTAFVFADFSNWELGVEQGFGNSGLNSHFNIRVNASGILQVVFGDKYLNFGAYDGLSHIVAARYTANTHLGVGNGVVELFLDSSLEITQSSVNMSGTPDTTIRLLLRGNFTPMSNGNRVGSFTIENRALTDTEISNQFKLLATRHPGVTLV